MQRLLLQKSSGCVYHWNEQDAANPDFEDYVPENVVAPAIAPTSVQDEEIVALAEESAAKKGGKKNGGTVSGSDPAV
jgi:hypothetical protein